MRMNKHALKTNNYISRDKHVYKCMDLLTNRCKYKGGAHLEMCILDRCGNKVNNDNCFIYWHNNYN